MPCTLLAGRRLELDHQFSGYPPAVFHFDSLRLGPLTDPSGVQSARRFPAAAASGPAGATANPPPSPYVGRQRVPQLLGVLGVEVDLILGAVQPEADRPLGGAAVDVIDEQGLYLLSYGRPGPLTGRLS